MLATVLNDRVTFGGRQAQYERNIRSTAEIDVDAVLLASQILDDVHQLGVCAFGAAGNHLVDGLQPLIARTARRGGALRLVTRAAQPLEVGFRRIRSGLLAEDRHGGRQQEHQTRECSR